MANNLQKELGDLEKQIDQITKRRADLLGELNKAADGVQSRKRSLGSDLLAGVAAVAGFDTLARDQIKVDALQEAISQADDQLARLKEQQDSKKRQIVMQDFNLVADEAYGLFLECMDQLHGTIAVLNALDAKLTSLDRVGAPAGISTDFDDHLRLLRQACNSLRGDFRTTDGIPWKIQNIEQSFPALLAKAWERKGL